MGVDNGIDKEWLGWINHAKPVEDVVLDAGFVISDTFYYGPENRFTQEQWQRLREPLRQPNAALYDNYLLTVDLKGSAAELIPYYQDVVRLAALHGKDMKQQSSYFWIRPLIFVRGVFTIAFPWYDSWEDAFPLLDALTSTGEGLLFNDLDQGWEFLAFADRERLFLRDGNFESGEEHFAIVVDRTKLAGQVSPLRLRVAALLQELSAALGRDYRSRRWSGIADSP